LRLAILSPQAGDVFSTHQIFDRSAIGSQPHTGFPR